MEVDTREAQKAGLLRPLVRREIENHMADFGLDPEFVTHNTMRGLSGGQKVKVVLAACELSFLLPSHHSKFADFCTQHPGVAPTSCCWMSPPTISTESLSLHSSRRSRPLREEFL